MKIIAKLSLFVFVSFLTTPPIISVIERDKDISTCCSFSEEEKIQKKITAITIFEISNATTNLSQLHCKLIFSKTCLMKIISSEIFIPPPKQV